MTRKPRRRGFTLVELVTVLAIVTIGLSLSLPAIQKSRADARQTQCRQNLKLIGLALHNYHDAYRTIPPGWTGHFREPGDLPRFGWQAALLPFLDQAPLYSKLDTVSHRMDASLVTLPMSILRCPSDPTADINSLRGRLGTSNYSGNFGPVAAPRWAASDFGAAWPGQLPTPQRTNGVFFWNSRIRFRDVLDGTSNTFFAGERSVHSRAGIWMGVRGNEYEDDQVTDCSAGNEINTGDNSYSSLHRGSANFLLMDGTVRIISQDIESQTGEGANMGTYQKLSHRVDGNPVGEF